MSKPKFLPNIMNIPSPPPPPHTHTHTVTDPLSQNHNQRF